MNTLVPEWPSSCRAQYTIYSPQKPMTLEERASQMWRVHPADLRNLGFETREAFYLAQLTEAVAAAVLQEREANAQISETWCGLMTLRDPALGPLTTWDLAVEETKTRVAQSIRDQKRSLL